MTSSKWIKTFSANLNLYVPFLGPAVYKAHGFVNMACQDQILTRFHVAALEAPNQHLVFFVAELRLVALNYKLFLMGNLWNNKIHERFIYVCIYFAGFAQHACFEHAPWLLVYEAPCTRGQYTDITVGIGQCQEKPTQPTWLVKTGKR